MPPILLGAVDCNGFAIFDTKLLHPIQIKFRLPDLMRLLGSISAPKPWTMNVSLFAQRRSEIDSGVSA